MQSTLTTSSLRKPSGFNPFIQALFTPLQPLRLPEVLQATHHPV